MWANGASTTIFREKQNHSTLEHVLEKTFAFVKITLFPSLPCPCAGGCPLITNKECPGFSSSTGQSGASPQTHLCANLSQDIYLWPQSSQCADTWPVWQTHTSCKLRLERRELLKSKSNIWHHYSKIFLSLYLSEPCQTNPLQLSGIWRSCSQPC